MLRARQFKGALAGTASLLLMAGAAAPAMAADEFGVKAFDGAVTSNVEGDAYTQAGGHPYDAGTTIVFSGTPSVELPGLTEPVGDPKTVAVNLPPGLVGNPQSMPVCEPQDFFSSTRGTNCPVETQVGVAAVDIGGGAMEPQPLYNIRPGNDDAPAAFGFEIAFVPIVLEATVRSGSDYGVTVTSANTNQGIPIVATSVAVWGVPWASEHDQQRCKTPSNVGGEFICAGGSDGAEPRSVNGSPLSFLTLPTACTAPGLGLETTVSADSWQEPGIFRTASFVSHLPPGYPAPLDAWGPPQGPEGCERVPFDPTVTNESATRTAAKPSGLAVGIHLPQDGLTTPKGLATGHLKRVRMTLPEGVSINPAAAGGLAACSDAQAGIGTDDDPACPAASKIGSVQIDTPVLDEPLHGSIYVGDQRSTDPASGEMFRLLLVARGPGVVVKLRGSVQPDERTGRLTATFDNNPQLPFSDLRVDLKDGARAPLAMPKGCGTFGGSSELASWSGKEVSLETPLTLDRGCADVGGFAPSLVAGTVNPIGGAYSPFALRVAKPDGQADIDGVELDLPAGLVANLKGKLGQRIGTARVAAGPGSEPFWLSGPVVHEGPYGDAPFSLRVTVPAVAGPFDLGEVVVRQKIYVDPDTAAVRVVSDPLPTIVKGVPVRLQNLVVDVDRPGFMVNPTSCAEKRLSAKLHADDGQTHAVDRRFQAAACQALAFKPKMTMRLAGKGQTKTGGHPAFSTTVRQGAGQANIGAVKVTMPKSIALDANNSSDKALVCDYDKAQLADCPASSIIGRATAHTPVLDRPLSGPVHLVQGIKFGPKGNRIRTTPALLVKLRGEVAIDLRGQTTTEKGTNRLVTRFAKVPDAPVSRFDLKVNGGKKGILVVTRTRRGKIDLCGGAQVASVETDGQNGKRADYRTTVKTPCGSKVAKAKRAKKGKRNR